MKKIFFALFIVALAFINATAQKIDLGKVIIDKDACTITNKRSGKTFPLCGRVQIVDINPDLRVQIVDINPDIYVQPHFYPHDCGQYDIVDISPDIRVQIVDISPDLKVQVRDFPPRINR